MIERDKPILLYELCTIKPYLPLSSDSSNNSPIYRVRSSPAGRVVYTKYTNLNLQNID